MFTGIVEALEPVRSITRTGGGAVIGIRRPATFTDVRIGDSIAVDGVCLTVVALTPQEFSADVSEETLSRSTLGGLSRGDLVNLERAMRADSRFGGHMVSGHVDGVVRLISKRPAGASIVYRFSLPAELSPYVVEKGSVAIAGISLTVASIEAEGFTVAVIPHTETITALGRIPVGSPVNMEVDLIGRYIVHTLAQYTHSSGDPRARDARLLDLLGGS